MLRLTPGALTSQRLEERPANLPSHLYVHGGQRPTTFSAVVFLPEGPVLRQVQTGDESLLDVARQRQLPVWLRISGLRDRRRIEALLARLDVPAELLPPLLDVPQRPRVDSFGEAVLVVLHRLGFAKDPAHLVSEQVGLLLLPDLLVTLEEASSGEPFADLTDWLISRAGAVEHRDLDDLLHFLIDDLLDDLFPMLESIANRLDDLEAAALRQPKPTVLGRTTQFRSGVRTIRSQIWPLRHQIRALLRQRQQLLGPEALGGFQEMADLVELLFDQCESLRAQCDAITQAYAASIGNRMNQVMKTLTILTSVFAPLTFIAGIYGMNFDVMPELHWRYGYLTVILLMGAVAVLQASWLWRRGWFEDWTTPRR
ncbi:magnesium/cobalt transporter CorA [Synechococcus sp. CBW1002]|uniref:magnesium/cobalt transporter CorA n=1 Tax=Synechococcus sp. CBW1002 TaxID=1353134 RepID=UPI001E3AA448|nr:magnesium/cobalt transporter CorA [Synechococcus sp. CBW1002]